MTEQSRDIGASVKRDLMFSLPPRYLFIFLALLKSWKNSHKKIQIGPCPSLSSSDINQIIGGMMVIAHTH